MKAESLIFDIDGTLWDTRALVAQGYNAQLESEGYGRYAVTAEDLTPLFGKSLPEMADVLFHDLPKPFRYELLGRCMEHEIVHLQGDPCDVGYPKVKETLE